METNHNHLNISNRELTDEQKLEKLKFMEDQYLNSLSQDQIQQYRSLSTNEKLNTLAEFKEKEDQYTKEKSKLFGQNSENFEELIVLVKKYLRTLSDKDIKRLKSQLIKIIKTIDLQIENNLQKEKEKEERRLAKEIEQLEKQIADKKDKLNFHL